jgi:hypothetical protein
MTWRYTLLPLTYQLLDGIVRHTLQTYERSSPGVSSSEPQNPSSQKPRYETSFKRPRQHKCPTIDGAIRNLPDKDEDEATGQDINATGTGRRSPAVAGEGPPCERCRSPNAEPTDRQVQDLIKNFPDRWPSGPESAGIGFVAGESKARDVEGNGERYLYDGLFSSHVVCS